VTVAIGAICQWEKAAAIICLEDRMVTSGDVEFEQPQAKIWKQGLYAVALMSGDLAAQNEIALNTERAIGNKDWTTEAIAQRYSIELHAYVHRLAVRAYLEPLGMTHQDFLTSQSALSTEFVGTLTRQLQDYYYDSGLKNDLGGAIIAGSDAEGAHLFKVTYRDVMRMDRIGFAAIGGGSWHAESHFMFSRYVGGVDFPSALSVAYAAKKRAEVAPGVGTETDIVIIGTAPRAVYHVGFGMPMVTSLEEIYSRTKTKHEKADADQHGEVSALIDVLKAQSTPSTPPQPVHPAPEAPPDPAPPTDVH
jgi:hypothetical protein